MPDCDHSLTITTTRIPQEQVYNTIRKSIVLYPGAYCSIRHILRYIERQANVVLRDKQFYHHNYGGYYETEAKNNKIQ